MRWPLTCVLALASGCVDEKPEYVPPEPDPLPQLLRTRTMAGELPIAGVDSDRAGGLWIAYTKATGGYYANDDVRLVHLDAHGTKTAEHRFTDTHATILGIAFDGHAVWMNVQSATVAGGGTSEAFVRAIDAVTGLEVARYTVEQGISDLEVDDARGELLLSSVYDRVVALALATGLETRRTQLRPEVPSYEGQQSALAITPDGSTWYASRFWDHLEVRDPAGAPIATYTTDIGSDHHTTDYTLFIAWDAVRGQVIAADENQISWLAFRGGTP